MRKLLLLISLIFPLGLFAQTPIVNCPSGFNSNTSGACSVSVYPASGSQQIQERTNQASVTTSGGVWQFAPASVGHTSLNGQYYTPIAISPGFISTAAWVPNGQNFAMTIQNTTNTPTGYQGLGWSPGASCEGGIYQGGTGTLSAPNNMWALQLGNNESAMNYYNYDQGIGPNGFTYSTVQMYGTNADPCIPFLGSNPPQIIAYSTEKVSTSPVPQQITANCTGSISGTTLTISACSYGTVQLNSQVLGTPTALTVGTYVTVIGTCGTGAGSCTVNHSQTVGSEALTFTGAQFSTTGDTYVSTVVYTGTHVTLTEYDQTRGNSCPGASCFTYTWPVVIPPLAGGTTAWVGFAEGSNTTLPGQALINSWVYSSMTQAATPTFSPAAGTYGSTQSVTISDATGSNYICYNFTGNPATNGIGGCANGTLYSGAISVPKGETIYAAAGVASANADSAVASAAYNITGYGATPTFYPGQELYYSGYQYVYLTAAQGSVICYNTTGSPATNGTTGCTTGTKYTGTPVTVSSNETLYAVAGGTGLTDSAVGSVAYTINPFYDPNAPASTGGSPQQNTNSVTFSPQPGTYTGTQTVTLSSASVGGSLTPYICYTLDTNPPTNFTAVTRNDYLENCDQGTLYTGPITISSSQTIYAMASTPTGSAPSSLVQASYQINSGTDSAQGVTVKGAVIQ